MDEAYKKTSVVEKNSNTINKHAKTIVSNSTQILNILREMQSDRLGKIQYLSQYIFKIPYLLL